MGKKIIGKIDIREFRFGKNTGNYLIHGVVQHDTIETDHKRLGNDRTFILLINAVVSYYNILFVIFIFRIKYFVYLKNEGIDVVFA